MDVIVQQKIRDAMSKAQAMLQDVIYAERWLQVRGHTLQRKACTGRRQQQA